MKLTCQVKDQALNHAKKEFPNESVGLVYLAKGKKQYFPCKNQSENPEKHFALDPSDYLKCAIKGDILAVIHSHPNAEPIPSEHDIKICERSKMPWFIVNPETEQWGSYHPVQCKE